MDEGVVRRSFLSSCCRGVAGVFVEMFRACMLAPVRGLRARFHQAGAFVRLGRPVFLGGGFVLYGLGAAIAAYARVSAGGAGPGRGASASIDWTRFAWGQAAITATQLMTHYCNDYFDFDADRANTTPTRWSGGSRVLPAGELPRGVALAAALLLAVAILLSWEYSAPPLRLHSTGWGELDVALVVSLLTPMIGFSLQTAGAGAGGPAPPFVLPVVLPLLAVLPLCCLQFAMLLAIEFPDAAGDAATGKRTLVVRLGAPRAAALYQGALAAAYLLLPILVAAGLPIAVAGAALLTSPIAAWQIARMRRGAFRDPGRWESLAFWSVALLIITSTSELAAFLLLLLSRR
jgi:1,4-dihydroxy-2-naphthoate octaprenyltransferase